MTNPVSASALDAANWVNANSDATILLERGATGAPASLIDNLGSPEGVIGLIGRSLRSLHDTPTEGAPLPDGWAALDAEMDARLEAGSIDPASLPDPYRRYDAARLIEMWRESRPSAGDDAPVVCHGWPSLERVIVDRTELIGFLGAERLCVGDRHIDLAIVHQSLQDTIGGEAAFIFYDAYGIDPNVVRLDHHLFAALLLS